MSIKVVILAAGQGKRMHSAFPKVLHLLAGKPLLDHVIATALEISHKTAPIIVYGHQGDMLQEMLKHHEAHWVEQKEQLGTGHALMQALPLLQEDDRVLVLYGDVPLISVPTLQKLIDATPANAMGMLTAQFTNPKGYGRIKRDAKQHIIQIIEDKDATEDERTIKEINPGIYFVPARYLKTWLPLLKNKNAQGEYYLTDIITFAVAEKISIHDVSPAVTEEILGVNDHLQLATLERFYQRQQAEKWLYAGVTINDPHRLDIRGDVTIGKDVILDVGVILEGEVCIGDGCVIGPYTILRDTKLGNNVKVKSHSVIEGAEIAADCDIGPFARIRAKTVLGQAVHIGNFVEIKNTVIRDHTKAGHLSYLGDADIGCAVNIGAGTITCNYDSANKNKTMIGDDVFIGSDTQLVAPVTIGRGATIGAGSTVVKDVSDDVLVLTHRLEQRENKHWVKPTKIK